MALRLEEIGEDNISSLERNERILVEDGLQKRVYNLFFYELKGQDKFLGCLPPPLK